MTDEAAWARGPSGERDSAVWNYLFGGDFLQVERREAEAPERVGRVARHKNDQPLRRSEGCGRGPTQVPGSGQCGRGGRVVGEVLGQDGLGGRHREGHAERVRIHEADRAPVRLMPQESLGEGRIGLECDRLAGAEVREVLGVVDEVGDFASDRTAQPRDLGVEVAGAGLFGGREGAVVGAEQGPHERRSRDQTGDGAGAPERSIRTEGAEEGRGDERAGAGSQPGDEERDRRRGLAGQERADVRIEGDRDRGSQDCRDDHPPEGDGGGVELGRRTEQPAKEPVRCVGGPGLHRGIGDRELRDVAGRQGLP